MPKTESKSTLLLRGHKKQAYQAYLRHMEKAKAKVDFPDTPSEAYLAGLREGYKAGMLEGVTLGMDVSKDSDTTFITAGIGEA